jgi:hypothetical protein
MLVNQCAFLVAQVPTTPEMEKQHVMHAKLEVMAQILALPNVQHAPKEHMAQAWETLYVPCARWALTPRKWAEIKHATNAQQASSIQF